VVDRAGHDLRYAMTELNISTTPIPGLLVVDLPVHGDQRGWFKENWHRAKMTALGLPDFWPVQQNVSYNGDVGTTRGIHAEPWNKLVSVAVGRAFGAWVDLRDGATFGTLFTADLHQGRAVFVPKGVGNAYQTLETGTAYSYLVDDHWSPDAHYTSCDLADESLSIPWPIPLDQATTSDKDRLNPRLEDLTPVSPPRTLVLGANGQVGRALAALLRQATFWDRDTFDITDARGFDRVDWSRFATIVNAAAYTDVDGAETAEGRREAWRVNAHGVVNLARTALRHNLTLVHISTDYVFDGTAEEHGTDELFAPLGVYGQSKAAGDAAVQVVPKHYLVRTSWVVGDGHNFISAMQRLAEAGVDPSVVDDQIGRLTYASDLAAGIAELLRSGQPSGTYNITSGGPPKSWYQIACEAFAAAGHDPDRVRPVSTEEYTAGKARAPRPRHSTLI
jgi:dTDP-4-dehydrorhamnose 3,5-epimerase